MLLTDTKGTPVSGNQHSVDTGRRYFFHPCCYCGSSHPPTGSYCPRCGAASASRILPGCCRGHRYVARIYCSLCDRGDSPGGRQKCHAGITQCVRAGCSAAPGLWRGIHGMCEARGGQRGGWLSLSLTSFPLANVFFCFVTLWPGNVKRNCTNE